MNINRRLKSFTSRLLDTVARVRVCRTSEKIRRRSDYARALLYIPVKSNRFILQLEKGTRAGGKLRKRGKREIQRKVRTREIEGQGKRMLLRRSPNETRLHLVEGRENRNFIERERTLWWKNAFSGMRRRFFSPSTNPESFVRVAISASEVRADLIRRWEKM